MDLDDLGRRDLLAVTQADSDASAGYAAVILGRLLADGPAYGPTALILVPTRDQAIRIHELFFQLSNRGEHARIVGLIEGKPLTSQIGPLKHGVDIAVGTPGRVLEHVKRKTLRIEQLKVLVFDGIDRMFDRRLGREIKQIADGTPKTRQTIVTFETGSERIFSFAGRRLRDPALIGVSAEDLNQAAPPEPAAPTANLYFGAGKGAGVKPRDLVGLITGEGGLSGDRIGAITIKQNFSLVAVPADMAEELVSKLRNSLVKGRKAKIRLERFRGRRGS